MAKSKKYKAEKQHQREEDLNETEALDNQFKELMEGRFMAGMVRPKGEKGSAAKGKSEDPEGAAFDVMRRELVFDAKAKVTRLSSCSRHVRFVVWHILAATSWLALICGTDAVQRLPVNKPVSSRLAKGQSQPKSSQQRSSSAWKGWKLNASSG